LAQPANTQKCIILDQSIQQPSPTMSTVPQVRVSYFLFQSRIDHRDLPSFPTRRSSDLRRRGEKCECAQSPAASASRTMARAIVLDRKCTRLNSSHQIISFAVFCLKKKIHALSFLYEVPSGDPRVPLLLPIQQKVREQRR